MSWQEFLKQFGLDPEATKKRSQEIGGGHLPGQYPVADITADVLKSIASYMKPITAEQAKAVAPESSLDVFDSPGGTNLAIAPISKKLAAEHALQRVKGVYVKPTAMTESGPINLGDDLTILIKGPGKGLAKYKALGETPVEWIKPAKDAGVHVEDINPVVRGYDRGDYTELVPEHTIVNKANVWGKLEDRLKEAERQKQLDRNIFILSNDFWNKPLEERQKLIEAWDKANKYNPNWNKPE